MRLAAIFGAALAVACATAHAVSPARPEAPGDESCDEKSNGLAWCEGEGRMVTCNHGELYYLDCASFGEGFHCGLDAESHAVDCVSDTD